METERKAFEAGKAIGRAILDEVEEEIKRWKFQVKAGEPPHFSEVVPVDRIKEVFKEARK